MNHPPNHAFQIPRARRAHRLTSALLCILGQALLGCTADDPPSKPHETDGFVHVEQGRVVDGAGRALWLRGVNFADWYWSADEIPYDHHDERDYERLAAMGMNTARLMFNYGFVEDESQPDGLRAEGVAWLDQNVEWARAHGVYLVLNFGYPPGGIVGVDCGSDAFWEGPELQDRFVASWRALAERYANDQTIAGYALFDGPNPSESLQQWQALAERVTASIREVDENHMLLVGRALSVDCVFDKVAEESFVRLDDPNVLYEFDRMQPWNYVAQSLETTNLPDYGAYPGLGVETWLHGSWDSRPGEADLKLKPDETEWVQRRFYYTVRDPKFKLGHPTLQSDNNSGTVYFDDIVINELDENGEFVRTVQDIDVEDHTIWYLWEGEGGDGGEIEAGSVAATVPDAHRGSASVTLSGTTTYANLTASRYRFPVVLGHTYEVTSWMKGEDSDLEGISLVRLDFWGPGGGDGFDKTTLEGFFDDFVLWGNERKLPLNVMAFGTGRPTFADRGGLIWANDMLDIMFERELHFTYYAYHDEEWGIYGNAVGLPDEATVNQPLADLFTAKLRQLHR